MSSIKPYEEEKDDSLHFKMSQKNACKYFIYSQKLEKIFDKENLIGAKSIYNKIINLFVLQDEELKNQIDKLATENAAKVNARFSKDKAYTFKIQKRLKNETYDDTSGYIDANIGKIASKTRLVTYSSAEMVWYAVQSAVHVYLEKEINKDKKEEIIRAAYLNIVHYASEEKKISEIISHYKASVISGYIALELGFTLSADLKPIHIKEAPPTNEQIYNAVKYFTEPLNKKKKRK